MAIFSNVMHPSQYHGFGAKPPFFEGWYYKLVSQDQNHRFAIIPGVYLAETPQKSHSFIQVFNSEADQVVYHRYPLAAFESAKDKFQIQIDSNVFTSDGIRLAIDDDLGTVTGSLALTDLKRWPVRVISPGAMGWFAWVPFMECYHGVVSMDHTIEGSLTIDGHDLDFSGGQGYIEKDWGKQFPKAWIWGQSNHFDRPGISLMMSVAVIPWLGRSFAGFIGGFLFQDRLYRFATYNRSKIEGLSIDDQAANLVLRNAGYRFHIKAIRAGGGLLQAPTMVEMNRRILETLNAKIQVRLEKIGGPVLYEGMGVNAGLETVGDLDLLMKMVKKY